MSLSGFGNVALIRQRWSLVSCYLLIFPGLQPVHSPSLLFNMVRSCHITLTCISFNLQAFWDLAGVRPAQEHGIPEG